MSKKVNEVRYICEIEENDFMALRNQTLDKVQKDDFYFKDYRIRRTISAEGEVKYFRIDAKFDGMLVKKIDFLGYEDYKLDLDGCLFLSSALGTYANVDGFDIYMEQLKVTAHGVGEVTYTYYSGEVEAEGSNDPQLVALEKLHTLSYIKRVDILGEVSIKVMTLDKLKSLGYHL